MGKEIKNKWHPCTDENYPSDDIINNVIYAYKLDKKEDWLYCTYNECPYGWTVLKSLNAYWMEVKSPD